MKTTDIDMDVNWLRKGKIKVDIAQILEALDFKMQFHGNGSY